MPLRLGRAGANRNTRRRARPVLFELKVSKNSDKFVSLLPTQVSAHLGISDKVTPLKISVSNEISAGRKVGSQMFAMDCV